MRELVFATGGHFVFIAYHAAASESGDDSPVASLVPLVDDEILAITRPEPSVASPHRVG